MKTRKEWENSDKPLDEFLSVGDRIDEAMFNYFGEVVAPASCIYDDKHKLGFNQIGEPMFINDSGTSFHETASYVDGKYYFVGVLPLFKP